MQIKTSKGGSYFIVSLEVYPFDVMVSFNETDKVLLKRLIDYGNSEEDCVDLMNLPDTTLARFSMLPSNQTIIRLKKQGNKYALIGVISHEIFHAATFILAKIGMTMEIGSSDEAYAYLVQYLTESVCRELKL